MKNIEINSKEYIKKPRNTGEVAVPRSSNIYKRNGKRIAVALSGGIDSAMAAKLLKDRGAELIGVTLKLLPGTAAGIYENRIINAREVSLKLNIPHVVLDLTGPFEEMIISPFCLEYKKGRTPNPCVECNKCIKFGALLDKIKNLGADYIATGHYCIIKKSETSGLYEIRKGIDKSKDQSYVLWRLEQDRISRIKTPIGEFSKNNIKKEVKKNFPFLKKESESQDICFIPENNYHSFIKSRIRGIKEGPVLDTGGKIIGMHKGYVYYTIGQRKGLGISHSKPLYVKEIIPEKNTIIAGEAKDILKKSLEVDNINFISGSSPGKTFRAMVKIRYNSAEAPAEIKITGRNSAAVTFDSPRKAVTPGQSAVFYSDDTLIGGGIIK
jgi:tRNA-uridine 2-sulfurtransferase